MAFTSDDLVRIDKALSSGNTSVQLGDRRVQRYTVDELMRIRALILSELGSVSGASSIIGVQYVATDKGLQ